MSTTSNNDTALGRSAHVHVLGSINWDLAVSVPRRPHLGETLIGHSIAQSPGGKGANQAVAASRLGVDVSMYGSVGDDDAGRRIADGFREQPLTRFG